MGGNRGDPGGNQSRGRSSSANTDINDALGPQRHQPESKSSYSGTKSTQSKHNISITNSVPPYVALQNELPSSNFSNPPANFHSHQGRIDGSQETISPCQPDYGYLASPRQREPDNASVMSRKPTLLQRYDEPEYHMSYSRALNQSPNNVGFNNDLSTTQPVMVDGACMYGRNEALPPPRNSDPAADAFVPTFTTSTFATSTSTASTFATDSSTLNRTFTHYYTQTQKVRHHKHREYGPLPVTSYKYLKKSQRQLMSLHGDFEEISQMLRDERNRKCYPNYPLPVKSWSIFLTINQEESFVQIPAVHNFPAPPTYEYNPMFNFLLQPNGQTSCNDPLATPPRSFEHKSFQPKSSQDVNGSNRHGYRRARRNRTRAADPVDELGEEDPNLTSRKTCKVEHQPPPGF